MKTKTRNIVIIVLSLMLIGVVAYQSNSSSQSCLVDPALSSEINREIDVSDARIMIQNRLESEDFILLDIRTPEEFSDEHIEGSINLDYYSESFLNELDNLDKDKTYLIYCRTANRTKDGSKIMKQLGFKEVFSIAGGIVEWKAQGLPTSK